MKKLVLVFFTFLYTQASAQSLSDFQKTIGSQSKAVQAIHTYPKDIRNGNCHSVPVTSITVSGDIIKITETWTNGYSGISHTILTGKISDDRAEGTWRSDYSSGLWSYNFTANVGLWNKTESMLGSFKEWQRLKFKIVNKSQLMDGEFPCD